MVCVFWSSWWTMRHCGIMGGDSWDYLFLVEQASVLSSLYRSRPCIDHPPYFDCPLLARVYRPRQASEYILIACLPPTIHSSTLSGCDGSFFAWNESYLLIIFGTQSLLVVVPYLQQYIHLPYPVVMCLFLHGMNLTFFPYLGRSPFLLLFLFALFSFQEAMAGLCFVMEILQETNRGGT